MTGAETQRLFFALWPDAVTRERLGKLSEDIPRHAGRRVPVANLHVTLVFLGSVDAEKRQQLEAMAETVRGTPFRLDLDCCGFWPRSRVAWVGASRVPAALAQLQATIALGVQRCGIEVDSRPYSVHLTLVRDARGPLPTNPESIVWEIGEFALVESQMLPEGARYTVLRTWPLRPAPNASGTD